MMSRSGTCRNKKKAPFQLHLRRGRFCAAFPVYAAAGIFARENQYILSITSGMVRADIAPGSRISEGLEIHLPRGKPRGQ